MPLHRRGRDQSQKILPGKSANSLIAWPRLLEEGKSRASFGPGDAWVNLPQLENLGNGWKRVLLPDPKHFGLVRRCKIDTTRTTLPVWKRIPGRSTKRTDEFSNNSPASV